MKKTPFRILWKKPVQLANSGLLAQGRILMHLKVILTPNTGLYKGLRINVRVPVLGVCSRASSNCTQPCALQAWVLLCVGYRHKDFKWIINRGIRSIVCFWVSKNRISINDVISVPLKLDFLLSETSKVNSRVQSTA